MESILSTVIAISLIFSVLLYKLRFILPWRVNCWFCNNNFWMKFLDRNCWTCPKCEQYNGFTKDGDYNKPLPGNDHFKTSVKSFRKIPPRNGLCKMCNVNQQLKVKMLANFVPVNMNNYDSEVDKFRLQLEDSYKLCSPCKKVLQRKLYKDKEKQLTSEVMENKNRSLSKKYSINRRSETPVDTIVKYSTRAFASILIIFISLECYTLIISNKDIYNMTHATFELISVIANRITSILKMKLYLTFPILENYLSDVQILNIDFSKIKNLAISSEIELTSWWVQNLFASMACLMNIISLLLHLTDKSNQMNYNHFINALLWVIYALMLWPYSTLFTPLTRSFIKLLTTAVVILIPDDMNDEIQPSAIKKESHKTIRNMANRSHSIVAKDEDSSETDDDVSLCKFGVHNCTDSSNEHIGNLNNSLVNGRSFTPRNNDSIWTKPNLNSTFCMNSALKTPSSVSDCVFVKPVFRKYQDLTKDDSDSDLDESIGSLYIGSPKKTQQRNSTVFSLRKFTAKPSFVAPMPLNRTRPLISPSKLGHNASWVAGGYWGSEGERQLFSINGSRSSSQSSGFESQTSSVNQRNIFSQPSSREESVCGDVERSNVFHGSDRFQPIASVGHSSPPPGYLVPSPGYSVPSNGCTVPSCGHSALTAGYAAPQNGYSTPAPLARPHVNSPVFPTLQYNSHIHIPQSTFVPHPAQAFTPQSVFPQNYPDNNVFKAPKTSSLIKLPQNDTFMAHS